jgi:hypothetical protein
MVFKVHFFADGFVRSCHCSAFHLIVVRGLVVPSIVLRDLKTSQNHISNANTALLLHRVQVSLYGSSLSENYTPQLLIHVDFISGIAYIVSFSLGYLGDFSCQTHAFFDVWFCLPKV